MGQVSAKRYFTIFGVMIFTVYAVLSVARLEGAAATRAAQTILFSSGSPSALVLVNANTNALARLPSNHLVHEDATWSSNGRRILFSGFKPTGGHSTAEIYSLNVTTRRVQRLTNNQLEDTNPVSSPDGQMIGFLEKHIIGQGSIAVDVMMVNASGSAITKLTTTPTPKAQLAWSPTGEFISFVEGHAGAKSLYVVKLSTGESTRIAENVSEASWSPNGKELAAVQASPGGARLIRIRPDGSQGRTLHRFRLGSASQPKWSPSGREIVFAHRRAARSDIERVQVDTGKVRIVTRPGPYFDSSPEWSPDGSRISLTRHLLSRGSKSLAQLAVADRVGRNLVILRNATLRWGSDPVVPQWRPLS
jgi:Tol biopolymer transport system component